MSIDGSETEFGNAKGSFLTKDMIGIGIVHFPTNSTMKCFTSCKGNLLGKKIKNFRIKNKFWKIIFLLK